MTLEVVDNGKGIELPVAGGAGLGLSNSRSRAEKLGGTFEVHSARGRRHTCHLVRAGLTSLEQLWVGCQAQCPRTSPHSWPDRHSKSTAPVKCPQKFVGRLDEFESRCSHVQDGIFTLQLSPALDDAAQPDMRKKGTRCRRTPRSLSTLDLTKPIPSRRPRRCKVVGKPSRQKGCRDPSAVKPRYDRAGHRRRERKAPEL